MPARTIPGVFCLEGPWSTRLDDVSSVRPLLDLLERRRVIRYIHRDAATVDEFDFYMRQWTQKRYANYSFGYLGFHGEENAIQIGRRFLTLEELAELLDGRCRGRTIYLGSCATLCISTARIEAFRAAVGARAVCGYVEDVDWIESAAFDLNLIDAVIDAKRIDAGFRRLHKRHLGECRQLGFRAVWKGGSIGSRRSRR